MHVARETTLISRFSGEEEASPFYRGHSRDMIARERARVEISTKTSKCSEASVKTRPGSVYRLGAGGEVAFGELNALQGRRS